MRVEHQSAEAAAKAIAFANGLRNNITITGRRWTHWPGGAQHRATIIARVDDILRRVRAAPARNDGAAEIAECISDLRALLEWTTYQSASLATARAIVIARRTRSVVEGLRLVDNPAVSLAPLVDSEASLVENVRTKNGYMLGLAERYPHLRLPQPLVDAAQLAAAPEKTPGRLALIRQLKNTTRSR